MRLLREQNECSLSWVMAGNRPAATVVSFIYYRQKIWMTALAGSARVRALRRNKYACVVVSGKGCEIGHSRCLSVHGTCELLDDKLLRDEIFPLFARAVLPNSEKGAAMMAAMMNSPGNLLLCLTPTKLIPYDGQQMLDGANSL